MNVINYLAILIATIVYYTIHMLWYFPFAFGNMWLELIGKDEIPRSKILKESIMLFFTALVTNLILAYVFDLTGTSDIVGGILISLLLYAGFVLPIAINQEVFNARYSLKLFLIEYGYYLVGFLISGTIISLWQ